MSLIQLKASIGASIQ